MVLSRERQPPRPGRPISATASRLTRIVGGEPLSQGEPLRFLGSALSRLRWGAIAALLVFALLQPVTGRAGLSTPVLVLVFAAYNLLGDILRYRLRRRFPFAWMAIMDWLVAAMIYLLGAQPGGPLFVLFILAVICAATSLSLRGTLIYTTAATLTLAVIEPTLPLWAPSTGHVRDLGARTVGLAVVGIGTTILARRLALEEEASRLSRDQAARLAELDRLRAAFVASISHDLQTPLAATRVSLGLLDASGGDRLRPDERELLDGARRNNERLGLLIDDLLAYNQLEAGTLSLDRALLDLRAVVAEAISTIHPLLEDREQRLEADLAHPLPTEGDKRRLEQAVVNLLVNAHRHTPPGTRIQISARTTARDVVLSVSDNGPGIPTAALEQIFVRFHRLEPDGKGSGLGLAIARGIIELHGGRVWAESSPGQGAVFHVALPRGSEGAAWH